MAANYYDSTQAKDWTFTRTTLAAQRLALGNQHPHLHAAAPLPDTRHLAIYIQTNLIKLARRLSVRQQALATAQIYLKRFYTSVEIRKTNPYLLMTTAVYLACKTEECPQHIRLMLGEAARQWPELGVSETAKIGECEFALISTLRSRLILHHPYRALGELAPLFGLGAEEVQLAHGVVNDSFATDLPLLHPPHVVALAAILLALVLKPAGPPPGLQSYAASGPRAGSPLQTAHLPGAPAGGGQGGGPAVSGGAAQGVLGGGLAGLKQSGPKLGRLVDWLAESSIDVGALVDATQELVSLYEVWESYSERGCKDAFTKMMQAGGK